MAYRNGNYAAFYVTSPFDQNNLRAQKQKDFVSYNLLKMWKGEDSKFPFNDSHDKNYDVRDGSDWEKTLKPRLHGRLSNSKNIILFLSSSTKNSTALKEEIDFGINTEGLPVIVVYPEYKNKTDIVTTGGKFKKQISDLWEKLPMLRDSIDNVPSIHVPYSKELIKASLENNGYMVNTKTDAGKKFYKL